MFLGWYDPDKKVTATAKLTEAVDRFREKFPGTEPEVCLTSCADAADLEREGFDALPVRPVTFIGRWTYYVGIEDTEAA
jgi:hypothetical protein